MPDGPDAPRRADELELLVESEQDDDGVRFTGDALFATWGELRVRRPLTGLAGGFTLTAPGRRAWPIRPGARVRVRIAGVQIIEGHVDKLAASTSKRGRRVTLEGRDKTADLVDCSATNEPGEWTDVRIDELVRQLAEPYGIEVTRAVDSLRLGAPLRLFRLQQSESAGSAIERALRLRALLAYTQGDGRLVISAPGESYAAGELVEGQHGNVIEAALSWTDRDRFRVYLVRGQRSGGDGGFGAEISAVEGRAMDLAVRRQRVLLSLADSSVTFTDAADRARWEATFRAARAQQLTVTVPGWRQGPDEGPWEVNRLVPAVIPSLGIDTSMLIDDVTFSRSRRSGTRTQLRLVPPDAYTPEPEREPEGPLDDTLLEEEWEVEGL